MLVLLLVKLSQGEAGSLDVGAAFVFEHGVEGRNSESVVFEFVETDEAFVEGVVADLVFVGGCRKNTEPF